MVETASPWPDLRSPTSSSQARTSNGALSATGTQSRAEAGLEPLMLRIHPPPPLVIPAPVQKPDSSCSSQPATTGTHPPTRTPAGLPRTLGGRPPTHSWRKASHTPTATTAAAAGGAYHTANGATGGVRVRSKAASANGAVPTTAAASFSEVGARTDTVGDAATPSRLRRRL